MKIKINYEMKVIYKNNKKNSSQPSMTYLYLVPKILLYINLAPCKVG